MRDGHGRSFGSWPWQKPIIAMVMSTFQNIILKQKIAFNIVPQAALQVPPARLIEEKKAVNTQQNILIISYHIHNV